MFVRAAHVQAGERIFVHGLSGAVGRGLLTLGKLQGAEIYGTASRASTTIWSNSLRRSEGMGTIVIDV